MNLNENGLKKMIKVIGFKQITTKDMKLSNLIFSVRD
jgi:hypothetical protein